MSDLYLCTLSVFCCWFSKNNLINKSYPNRFGARLPWLTVICVYVSSPLGRKPRSTHLRRSFPDPAGPTFLCHICESSAFHRCLLGLLPSAHCLELVDTQPPPQQNAVPLRTSAEEWVTTAAEHAPFSFPCPTLRTPRTTTSRVCVDVSRHFWRAGGAIRKFKGKMWIFT